MASLDMGAYLAARDMIALDDLIAALPQDAEISRAMLDDLAQAADRRGRAEDGAVVAAVINAVIRMESAVLLLARQQQAGRTSVQSRPRRAKAEQ